MFDNSMTRGTPALIMWLTVVTLVLTVVFAVITTVFRLRSTDTTGRGFWHELFYTLLHALDPGYIGGDVGSWGFLLVMLLLTIGGLFIVSALIGVIANGIDAKLADLRRGRSIVLEEDHSVILGWSDSIFTIISELTLANESRKDPVIVILADRDKVDMEEELRVKVPERRGTRIICRSGSPMDIDDLRLSSHETARSVILLAPDSDDPDAEVIKTLLALTHAGDEGPRIVAEIQDPSNLEAAALVGKGRTTLLDIRETVAKLVVQTSRQSGAAAVYTELFDYAGDEFYFFEDHGLAGSTYAEAQQAFEAATVVGVIDGDTSKLNPPPETVITAEQTLIVVVEDDSALEGQSRSLTEPALNRLGQQTVNDVHPTQALLIGWNDRAPIVLRELDRYAPPGSSADGADCLRGARRAGAVQPHRHRGQGLLDPPRGARGARGRRPRPDHRALLRPGPRCPGRRLAHPGLPPPHPRHPAQGRLGDPGGQRDDRRPQPGAGLRGRRRRHRRERGDRVAADHPALRGRSARGGLPGAAGLRRQRDLPAPRARGTSSPVTRSRGRPWWPGPRDRNETAIGLKSALLADPGMKFGVVVNPPKSQTYRIGPDDAVVVLAED